MHVNLTKYAMGMTPFVLDNLFKSVQEFMDIMMSVDLFDLYNLVFILVSSIKIVCGSCKHLEMSMCSYIVFKYEINNILTYDLWAILIV